MQASQPSEPSGDRITSPFSDIESPSFREKSKNSVGVWVVLGLIAVLIAGVGGFFLIRHLNDPLRTLEPFPVSKYLENHKTLAGSKFRGNLRVENDLGWKENVGRLMVFSFREDSRSIVIMIPPSLARIYFTKGQTYAGELEVKEGGLIYANSVRKD